MMRKSLLTHGYRECEPCKILYEYAKMAYQRAIRDSVGQLYFITVYEYDPVGPQVGPQFMAEGHFHMKDNRVFKVHLYNFDTVNELQQFFKKIYFKMGCVS